MHEGSTQKFVTSMFWLPQPPSSTPGGVSSTAAWQGLICAASCRSDTSLCYLAQLCSHSTSPASRDALAGVKHHSPYMTSDMNACGEVHHPAPRAQSPNLASWSKHWWVHQNSGPGSLSSSSYMQLHVPTATLPLPAGSAEFSAELPGGSSAL